MRNTMPGAYTAVPVTITGITGHVAGITGHVAGITGHVRPEYSPGFVVDLDALKAARS